MLKWKELVDRSREFEGTTTSNKDDQRLLQIYLCRLHLVPGAEISPGIFSIEDNLTALGIDPASIPEADSRTPSSSSKDVIRAVRKRERQLTRSLKGEPRLSFEPLLASLVHYLKPNMVELKLLIFAILLVKAPQGRQALRELDINEFPNSVSAMARAFQESPREVARALDENAMLCQIRLLEPPGRNTDIYDLVEAGPLLHQLVMVADGTESGDDEQHVEQALFRNICPVGPPPEHQIGDFKGVPELQLMLDYISEALQTKARGRNILLHGKPGTGKTQLARAMAEQLGAPLYEVPTRDATNSAMTGRIRLDAAKLAQMFLEDRLGAILLFDEMEDAFRKEDHLAKGWFNQLLEENQAPVIWISNDITRVDPAFLRRFDFIIELDMSSSGRQAEKFREELAGLPVSGDWIDQAAKKPWMTPALVHNLARVGRFLPPRQLVRNEQRLEALLKQRLRAMRETDSVKVLKKEKEPDFPAFRAQWLTTTPSLRSVERLVRKEGSARLCLYGPPGAGKTAYAEALAKRLKKPFILQSGSDLLGMFVGETEKRIAEMFDKAEQQGAVLLLDEADTFLYNRGTAVRSWEVSSVNEFMVRLERFDGVFLATTNRFDSLDKAVLRRFQLKVKFGYLDQRQLQDILRACVPDPENVDRIDPQWLSRLDHLTPGLVRSATQSLRLRGLQPRLARLLEALEKEQKEQTDGVVGKPIGFSV